MNAVDPNILLYIHDPSDQTKQQRAIELVSTLGPDTVLLWQVACEYINASRKMQAFGLDYWPRSRTFTISNLSGTSRYQRRMFWNVPSN